MRQKKLIIAGPCAAENEAQVMLSAGEAKKRGIDFLRVSLWKPRTKPGFDGLGEKGIKLLVKVAKMGINPATEVIVPSHAEKVINEVLNISPNSKILLWIGARNQNHYIQQEIAHVVANEKRVMLMVKNQPWPSLEHWEGIIEHVLHGGINHKNLIICHRGFSPNGHSNPHGYRNIPDYEMSMKIKQKFSLPMLFDPSHTGGSVTNVLRLAKEATKHSFDGMVVEVHPNPKTAKIDAKQQLTWKQFDDLLKLI